MIRVCFTTGHLLQDPAVFLHFGKEPRLAAQLSGTLRQLEHLLEEKAYHRAEAALRLGGRGRARAAAP